MAYIYGPPKLKIKTAVNSLMDYYSRKGQGYDIYVPLIGTGMSRSGITLQESFDMIVSAVKERGRALHGEVNIVMKQEAASEIDYSYLK